MGSIIVYPKSVLSGIFIFIDLKQLLARSKNHQFWGVNDMVLLLIMGNKFYAAYFDSKKPIRVVRLHVIKAELE